MTPLEQSRIIAHAVRKTLLHHDATPRDLAGQCGLAALLVALRLDDPRVLRTGFYMRFETFLGKRGRYPYRHAWCCVETMIVDVTATQFDQSNRAVHVTSCDDDPRYIETARGSDALDDIMANWRGSELPAYVQLAKYLRRERRPKHEDC